MSALARIEAEIAAGRLEQASKLCREELAVHGSDPAIWELCARLAVLQGADDVARQAQEHAKRLRAQQAEIPPPRAPVVRAAARAATWETAREALRPWLAEQRVRLALGAHAAEICLRAGGIYLRRALRHPFLARRAGLDPQVRPWLDRLRRARAVRIPSALDAGRARALADRFEALGSDAAARAWLANPLVAVPELVEVALDERWLELARHALGGEPSLREARVARWLDVEDAREASRTGELGFWIVLRGGEAAGDVIVTFAGMPSPAPPAGDDVWIAAFWYGRGPRPEAPLNLRLQLPLGAAPRLGLRQRAAARHLGAAVARESRVRAAHASDPELPIRFLTGPEARAACRAETRTAFERLRTGRISRDRVRVEAEYERSHWRDKLEQRAWVACASPLEYLVPASEASRIVLVDGRVAEMSTRDYYRFRIAILRQTLLRYASDTRELYELGCGEGVNLLSLALSGGWDRLCGFDISSAAVRAARASAQHFGLDEIEVGQLDLLDAASPVWPMLRGKVVFSYYCLEQLGHDPVTPLENLIRAGVRRVVHIENVWDELDPRQPADLATLVYTYQRDYQQTLERTIRAFEARGRLRVLAVERLGYAPTPKNDPTLICWEPLGPDTSSSV
jgi:hypothetical protein